MAGSKRVLGLPRAFAPGAMACVLGASACYGSASDPGPSLPPNAAGSAGSIDASTGGALIGAAGGGPLPLPITPGCTLPPAPNPVFESQAVGHLAVARRELFSWTTDEQAAALRSDQVLFTKVEQEGLGPGYAFDFLKQLAQSELDPEQQQLATLLSGDLFSKKRYAWSEPWATRLGWPGEDYGSNLLRIVLRPEAWVVVVSSGTLSVIDLDNQPVDLAEAVQHPERIGAIYYVKDAAAGGPFCSGSFNGGSNGYREFILGNLAMVEEWSIGTQGIRDRLAANIADLSQFFTRTRVCPTSESVLQWNLRVVCSWANDQNASDDTLAYEQALAIPSANYLPVPQQIATLIETLQGDLFEPDPLVVKPGSL